MMRHAARLEPFAVRALALTVSLLSRRRGLVPPSCRGSLLAPHSGPTDRAAIALPSVATPRPSAVAIVPDRFITARQNEGTFGVFDRPGIRGQNQHLDQVQSGQSIEPIFERIFSARSIAGRDAHRSLKDVGGDARGGHTPAGWNDTSKLFFIVRQKSPGTRGEPTAERLKIRIGSAGTAFGRESVPVMGRSVSRGVPQAGLVAAGLVHDAMEPVLDVVGNAVEVALRATPPELRRHLAGTGIVLTGGSASIHALDAFLARRCGLLVRVADDPASCVARGLGGYFDQPGSGNWRSAPQLRVLPGR
jgi:hypothetical protein